MARLRPPYFEAVRTRVHERWDKLKSDEDLAAPWYQLFSQLRSDPRHVISELLQNADDAGATWARVGLESDVFTFEHNGRDFTAGDFESLCSFGHSNKRRLHTIGFRGIGFKTTFSLGRRVRLLTPTLAVEFAEDRFTEPIWVEDTFSTDHTAISIKIDSTAKIPALQQYMEAWVHSCVPLLFFNYITKLTILGSVLCKIDKGEWHVPGSRAVTLRGTDEQDVIVFESAEEDPPGRSCPGV